LQAGNLHPAGDRWWQDYGTAARAAVPAATARSMPTIH
jgi:hypothetical protein